MEFKKVKPEMAVNLAHIPGEMLTWLTTALAKEASSVAVTATIEAEAKQEGPPHAQVPLAAALTGGLAQGATAPAENPTAANLTPLVENGGENAGGGQAPKDTENHRLRPL